MRISSITLVVALSWLADITGRAPAHAHDWYPVECCGQHDCMPARAVEGDGQGGMTVVVGDHRIGISRGFAVRLSLDSRIHVCFRMQTDEVDGNNIITPICLFLPAQT